MYLETPQFSPGLGGYKLVNSLSLDSGLDSGPAVPWLFRCDFARLFRDVGMIVCQPLPRAETCLLVMCGLPAAGKTSLTAKLCTDLVKHQSVIRCDTQGRGKSGIEQTIASSDATASCFASQITCVGICFDDAEHIAGETQHSALSELTLDIPCGYLQITALCHVQDEYRNQVLVSGFEPTVWKVIVFGLAVQHTLPSTCPLLPFGIFNTVCNYHKHPPPACLVRCVQHCKHACL